MLIRFIRLVNANALMSLISVGQELVETLTEIPFLLFCLVVEKVNDSSLIVSPNVFPPFLQLAARA